MTGEEEFRAVAAAHPEATDIHAEEGGLCFVRERGRLIRETAGDLLPWLISRLPLERREELAERGACDGSFSLGSTRCRLHVYRAAGKISAAVRLLPSLAELPNDPDGDWFEELAGLTSGLILVTGPTGSGKTTALARLVLAISERPLHIITIEDPAEYIFAGGAALIHQREAGRDTASFSSGVREALREDPDVIVIGEMRDEETIAAALTAAETGHLVLATMHDASAAGAAGRIVHAFPPEKEKETRALLASVLRAAAAQRLWRYGEKTCLLREILMNIPAVSRLIRDGKDEQLASYMEMGTKGMRTMRQAAGRLAERERFSPCERKALFDSLEGWGGKDR